MALGKFPRAGARVGEGKPSQSAGEYNKRSRGRRRAVREKVLPAGVETRAQGRGRAKGSARGRACGEVWGGARINCVLGHRVRNSFTRSIQTSARRLLKWFTSKASPLI